MDEHREIDYVRTLHEASVLLGWSAEELRARQGSETLIAEIATMMRRIERVLSSPARPTTQVR